VCTLTVLRQPTVFNALGRVRCIDAYLESDSSGSASFRRQIRMTVDPIVHLGGPLVHSTVGYQQRKVTSYVTADGQLRTAVTRVGPARAPAPLARHRSSAATP
jgi:hypothetical protein